MVDRERALHLLMGRYRYEEAMRLFGEYCLLMDEEWNDFISRHTPLKLRQIHKQLGAVGLWPEALKLPQQRGTNLLNQARGAVTGLLTGLMTHAPDGAQSAPAASGASTEPAEAAATATGRDPEQVLASLVSPALALECSPSLVSHGGVGGEGSPLHDAIARSRFRLAQELGFVFPLVHLGENVELAEGRYAIRLNGEIIAEGHVSPDGLAAIGFDLPAGLAREPHPVRHTPMAWIAKDAVPAWAGESQTPAQLIAEHLEALVRRFAYRLLNNQAIDMLLRAYEPEIGKDTLAELFGRFMSLTELRFVLQSMLQAGYGIRNFPRIVDLLITHYINYLATKPLGMDETWKISSHIPFFPTEELTRVVCEGLGLPPAGGGRAGLNATLERIVRESPAAPRPLDAREVPPPPDLDRGDTWDRPVRDPGKGAS